MRCKKLAYTVLLSVASVGIGFAVSANATTVTVNNAFVMLDNVSANSEGALAGEDVFYGANSVFPNGSSGTTGAASVNGSPLSRPPLWIGNADLPNMFARESADSVAARGSWLLSFTNGADTTTVSKTLSATATQAPFINSLSISYPTSQNPVISWSPPPGATVNGYRVNIYDASQLDAIGHPTQIFTSNLLNTQTSFTIPNSGNHQAGDIQIQPGSQYIFEVQLLQTRDGSSDLTSLQNQNILARSRLFSVFNQPAANSPTQIYLPVALSSGSYQFNMQVTTGQTYYIDPTVATGYVYKTSPGEPNFASVVLPNLQGSTPYHLSYVYGGNNFAVDLLGGVLFNFQSGGVDQFTVTGIDPTLMLNPNNSTAFITGLTFTSDGQFTGTQTAITEDVAATPLPPGFPLFATGVGALGLLGWRKKKKAVALVGGGFVAT